MYSGTLCIAVHYVQWFTMYSGTLCTAVHYVQWFTMYSGTLCTLCIAVHYVQRYTMYSGTLCTVVHYVQRYTMYSGTLCTVVHYVQRYTMYSGTLCTLCTVVHYPMDSTVTGLKYTLVHTQQIHYAVVITSKLDVITSKWRRFDVITTLLLHHVFRGQSLGPLALAHPGHLLGPVALGTHMDRRVPRTTVHTGTRSSSSVMPTVAIGFFLLHW